MPQNRLINTIKDLGLTENEAQVYYASLSLGPSTILKIARAADLKRTTVYSVVESLKKIGLINIQFKGIKQLFAAESPDKLESMLDIKRQELNNNLPELQSLYNLKGGESLIKYYEGLESVKTVYEQILKEVKPNDDYRVISDTAKWMSADPKYYQSFLERRAKKNIYSKIITKKSPTTLKLEKFKQNYKMEQKFMPEKVAMTVNQIILPHKFILHQFIPPIMAIVIENKSIIRAHQETFDLLWQSL